MPYSLFCIGNPLLDLQVTNGEELLKKYGLKANDAILAEEKHAGIYNELVKEHKVTYVAGGAAQNAARGAAYILPPGSVAYSGCVGDDVLAEQLRAANKREGLDDYYLVKKGGKTGACAVVITGHNRSLVTTLEAAEKFEQSHLASLAPILESAKVIYTSGFFLTHGISSALEIAEKANATGKTFVLNFSAPFIPQFFGTQLDQLLPYTDVVIGNESEAEAWASANISKLPSPDVKDYPAIARTIAKLPKHTATPRIVIITHGAESTVWVSSANLEDVKVHPVTALSDAEIVDTNGAGDAFAGGFLGAIVTGKTVPEAVEVGHKMGAMCVGQVGPQYKWPKVQIL